MKSDCCGAEIIVDESKLYRCSACNRNSGIYDFDFPKHGQTCHVCGQTGITSMIGHAFLCGMSTAKKNIKLPLSEQVKAIVKRKCVCDEMDPTIDKDGLPRCANCDTVIVEYPIPKLTPSQLKVIRWPSGNEIFALFITIAEDHEDKDHAFHLEATINWAIRYALQDLIDQEEI